MKRAKETGMFGKMEGQKESFKNVKPDDICEKFYKLKPKISIQIDNHKVLIEGREEALRFLGELLIAQATYKDDCGFYIHPSGPGKIFFSKKSVAGIYIHRLPCLEKKSIALSKQEK